MKVMDRGNYSNAFCARLNYSNWSLKFEVRNLDETPTNGYIAQMGPFLYKVLHLAPG